MSSTDRHDSSAGALKIIFDAPKIDGARSPVLGTAASREGSGGNTTNGGHRNEQAGFDGLVSRGLTAALQQKGGTLTMRLIPETLGSLKIQMDLHQGNVSINLEASSPEAQRLLMQSLDTLRASLESKGLGVDRIGVTLVAGSENAAHGSAAAAGGARMPGQDGQQQTGSGSGGDARAWREDSRAQANTDAGDGRSRGWLGHGGREQDREGGAPEQLGSGADALRGFDDELLAAGWSRVRLGVNALA